MKDFSNQILPGIIEFRHELHRHPELAGQEFQTQKLIRERLKNLDLEVLPPFLETDTVALIYGTRGAGKNVTLRADIDALALKEMTGAEFCSLTPGKMHACGHDMHTAMLMGAAEILASRRNEFAGSVRLVWQPGEENKGMARKLVAAGALDQPLPDMITAIHVCPGLPVGTIGSRVGAIMSSSCHFKVTVTGHGGHGSVPYKSTNALLAAATMVKELQNIVPNRVNPQQAASLSIGMFQSGALDNVIPDEAVFAGTIRTLDAGVADVTEQALQETCEAVAKMYRVEVEVNAHRPYDVLNNDPQAVALARQTIEQSGIPYYEFPESGMASEDFCFYAAKGPVVYVKLGIGEKMPPLHNSKLLPPDEAMVNGIKYLVNFALAALKE